MAYNLFTLESIQKDFDLTITAEAFCQELASESPSETFRAIFEEWFPLAQQARSEKAKSELLVSPILLEVRKLSQTPVSVFSGEEFTVDRARGLNGYCDFLVSRSNTPYIVEAPVIMLVEAKKGELDLGFGQCIAEMMAAQIFNYEAGRAIPCIYGSVTSGRFWQFLKLESQQVTIDVNEYPVHPVERILGILKWMIDNQ
jgi:hypothetical protein